MRCLILGGDGMLGHQLLKQLVGHEVRVTLRGAPPAHSSLFCPKNTYDHVDVRDTQRLIEVFGDFHPEAVINAVGVIKQRPHVQDRGACIEINALFPHRLLALCRASGARLVHVSTDCVFSGTKGNYTEHDLADATDVYGRSKYLGEVEQAPAITLRTSIIGLELKNFTSLVEWFLQQRGTIRGFRRAIYSGVTTSELARVIQMVLEQHAHLCGTWHVAAEPISKFDLLQRLRDKLNRTEVTLTPDETFVCDRGLNGSAFGRTTGYQPPSWDVMLEELAMEIQRRTRGLNCYDAA